MTTDSVTILPPAHALTGKVSPPGSKSITNRALLLAGLAKGTSRLTGALKSDDTRYMAEALRQMGVTVEEPDATTFVVTSSGELKAPAAPLFLGNAGTATRFLTAALALGKGRYIVDGDEHMRKRPIKPLVEALAPMSVNGVTALVTQNDWVHALTRQTSEYESPVAGVLHQIAVAAGLHARTRLASRRRRYSHPLRDSSVHQSS